MSRASSTIVAWRLADPPPEGVIEGADFGVAERKGDFRQRQGLVFIEPGNWGRLLNLYEVTGGQIQGNVLNEALLEFARQLHAPTAPSRLRCIFAVLTLPEAIALRNKHQRYSIIHEVEPLDPSASLFVGDYELAIQGFTGRYFPRMLQLPVTYWTQAVPTFPEILLDCAVRVVAAPVVLDVPLLQQP
jgi:hypothetical protein